MSNEHEDAVAAAKAALAKAEAELAAAKAAAGESESASTATEIDSAHAASSAKTTTTNAEAQSDATRTDSANPASEDASTETSASASTEATDSPASSPVATTEPTASGPLDETQVETIRAAYAFEETALELGALVNGEARADVPVRIPLAMTNRHGLVAGATGTGKTKTLQVMLEQLSAAGVPVFAADIKGDLSGIATPGTSSEKLLERTQGIGQDWQAQSVPTEFYSLGGRGQGVPIRATVTSFGPLMLAKVLGLNATQESVLALVFHYADQAGLPLVNLEDLRSVLQYLTSDEGKPELEGIGGVSKQTAGVILRELTTFAAAGADVFFGEPEIDTNEFLRTASDGRGIVSLLEIPGVAQQPEVFSTFLMWLLADLFATLPEVGDIDKPKLVFFFDEAHLLFNGASKDFVSQIVQTVRLIRSKGVGIFFVTQTPKDVPNDVLAQLGSRVQHQLRAHTPDDAKSLRATVRTYPESGYDLEETLTQLATGEAIVTVMNEKGAPTPVAWVRMRAPQGSMDPTPTTEIETSVKASPLLQKYGTPIDPESAHEILAKKMNESAEAAKKEAEQAAADKRAKKPSSTTTSRREKTVVDKVLGSGAAKTVVREVTRGLFGMLFKK